MTIIRVFERFFLAACLCVGWLYAPTAPVSAEGQQQPIRLGISKTLYLPEDMYGQWSITSHLEESNRPQIFSSVSHDLWLLEQSGGLVTVSNPSTGASATITVDEVKGNTATFHRMITEGNGKVFYEIPTVTVDGDVLRGITLNKYEKHHSDGRVQVYFGRYRLHGVRVSGARVRFGEDRPPVEPDFEIEDVRKEDPQ